MPSRTLKSLRALATLAVLSAAITAASSRPANAGDRREQSQDYGASVSNRTLEGTWWVQVTLTDCASRMPLASFSALLTFARGGTMTGTTTNAAFAIGQRSPDHGVWFRARAPHTFRASSVAMVLFTTVPKFPVTPGFQAGSQRLDQTIAVTDPDHFTSNAVTRFFDAAGQEYRQGCATAAGARFE